MALFPIGTSGTGRGEGRIHCSDLVRRCGFEVKIVAVSDVRLKAARENEKMHEEGKEMKKEEM